jgi:hypothetical protein
MRSVLRSRRSPAVVISILALVAGITGAAVAGPTASKSVLNKKEKKQVRNIAGSEITKRAPGLAVASAKTADSAKSADSAQPALFAHVGPLGDIDTANSKGITPANMNSPSVGTYCFLGISGGVRGLQAVVDYNAAIADETTQVGLGAGPGCPAGTQAFVATFTGNGSGTPTDVGTFVLLYR